MTALVSVAEVVLPLLGLPTGVLPLSDAGFGWAVPALLAAAAACLAPSGEKDRPAGTEEQRQDPPRKETP